MYDLYNHNFNIFMQCIFFLFEQLVGMGNGQHWVSRYCTERLWISCHSLFALFQYFPGSILYRSVYWTWNVPLIDWRCISNADLFTRFWCTANCCRKIRKTHKTHSAIAFTFQIASNILNEPCFSTTKFSDDKPNWSRYWIFFDLLVFATLLVILTTIITANIFSILRHFFFIHHVKTICILQSVA